MSSRVAGAGLALIAVALLAVAIATPAVLPAQLSLFAGHPTVANHTRVTQEVYVGLTTAELCNSGGDGTCKTGDATTAFRLCGYGELALSGGLALLAITLAILTLQRSEGRKTVARLIWLVGALALADAGAMIALGPFHGASVPIGIGMAVHGAGILGAALGAALAARPPPPIRLRVGERGAQPMGLPAAHARDRRAQRAEAMRASDAGADRLGFEARTRPPPQPLDAETPSDPFAAPLPPGERTMPSGPQLRPLYEAAPLHGGTGGLVPPPQMAGMPPPPSGLPPPPPMTGMPPQMAGMPPPPSGLPPPPPMTGMPPPPSGMPPPLPMAGMPPPIPMTGMPPPIPMSGMPPQPPMTGMPPQPPMPGMPPQPRMPGMPPQPPMPGMQPPPGMLPHGSQGMPPHGSQGMPPHGSQGMPPPMPPSSRSPALPFADAVPPFIADEPHAAGPPFAPDEPHAARPPFAADELHAVGPPFAAGDLRSTMQQSGELRPPPSPITSDPHRPTVIQPASDAALAIPPPFTDEPRQTAPRYSSNEPRPAGRTMPPPPPPGVRSKPPSVAPPPIPPGPYTAPPQPVPAVLLPHGGQTGYQPRTQVSLVPPMPDNDLPIAPPTAQIEALTAGSMSSAEPTLFPRAETPLAPPPLPVPPPPGPRSRSDSQLPPPLRGTQLPRPPLRAAVPMPARPERASPGPTQPPVPSTLRGVPLRPTISTTVPPIPAIPAIPPIPVPKRPDTDVTDPEGDASADLEAATVSRVPIELGEYDSQTNVSVGLPPADAAAAGGAPGASGRVPDTAPSGQPHAVATSPADQPTMLGAAVIAASRPTVQIAEQRPDPPAPVAPPLSRTTTPQGRGAMPKLPISTAPDSLPPPKDSKQALGPSPACPQCESPMAWVEEHLRFYCKSCRMYF